MGYRRDTESQRAWQKWIDENRDDLIRCSLPDFLFADKWAWIRFLEHGGWHPQPLWTIGMLSPHHASALHEFIRRLYGPDEYRYLLQCLEEVVRNPAPPWKS